MPNFFMPDYMFRKFDDITSEFLASMDIGAILVDIDNTLATYEQAIPTEDVVAWIESLKCAGISVALVSNNNAQRVEKFSASLGIAAYPKCKKPRIKVLKKALVSINTSKKKAAFLGDQIFTDVVSGKRLGLTTFIVPPIKDKKTLFFRFKRALEFPIIKKFKEEHNIDF